jgi:cytochrome P450
LLDDPENFYKLMKRYAAAVTGALTYGKRPKSYEDPLCQDVVTAMGYIAENAELGATPPIDQFPFTFLKHVPARFAYWKRRAITHGQRLDAIFGKLWDEYQARRKDGRRTGSLFDKFLDENERKGQGLLGSWRWGLHSLQFLGGEILEGGADTTSSTLISMIMAMACNPDVLKRAHEQLDAAVGPDRTPQWSDYDSIPYIAQIQKETIRWRAVTVMGTPHVVREDDTYKGYKLPKGAWTIQNTWSVRFAYVQ